MIKVLLQATDTLVSFAISRTVLSYDARASLDRCKLEPCIGMLAFNQVVTASWKDALFAT